ncbi:ATPase, AAA-type, core [Pochonia chlamydosporia 170]|uniref:ATPase, AAA-type, core n=1 Tax=Pochonia chlamydosporia 170 TaxID=1380566 RepID=A0A179EYN8_METCM|nr:ATPase, AAA-type, core [Pochonia chlamydosporia 170]OAQ58272.1 ATPase, AAA-type, core [Pochonia chlamydosporia 170]
MSYLLRHKNSAEDALKEANDWFGLAPSEKQVTSRERKSKESLETPQHPESGLWMKTGNEEEPTEKQIKRTKKFADLKLIIPVSPPPSPCASTPPLSAVGECVVHTTSGPPDAGAGTEPDIVVQDHCSKTDCNLNAQIWDTDIYSPLDPGARKMTEDDRREVAIQGWGEEKPSSADAALASVSGSDDRSRLLEREPKCGSGVRDPTWRAGKNITVTTSIEQVVTLNTGAAEHTKFETEVKAILPSNPDNTNAASCLPPISMTSDDNGPTSTPSKTQIGVAQPRPLPMNVDGLRTLELPEAHPLFSSDRDGLSEDNTRPTVCGPGCCKGSQLFDHQIGRRSIHDLVDQTKDYGGMDTNHGLPLLSECVPEPNTQETPAKNKPQPETGAFSSTPAKVSCFSTPSLSDVGTPVSKLCTPSSAKTDVVELAVEAERPRDDSEAKTADEICGTDVDFDLNCGARKITEEDFVRLGLHTLSWAKLSDAITDPPPMSKPDLHGLENASKDSPFLVNGANPRDNSEENMEANKTGLDVGNSKLPVTNADSSLSMKLDPPIDFFGGMGQQTSLSKTPDVNSSDGADESVWVMVEVGTDNLATYTDM